MAEFYIQKKRPISMQNIIILAVIAIAGIFLAMPDSTPPKTEAPNRKVDLTGSRGEFIKKYALSGSKEGRSFRIPPSIILGVGATNSEGYVDVQHHNIFRLKPDTNWDGEVITFANQEGGEYTLKKYDSAFGSFRDFSITVCHLTNMLGIKRDTLTREEWVKVLQEADICNGGCEDNGCGDSYV